MGNYYSSINQLEYSINCPICKGNTKQELYLDLECSKCKQSRICYYHTDCIHKYPSKEIKFSFICSDCSVGNDHENNLLYCKLT